MADQKNVCDLILLSRYADQETNPEETRQIQAHLLFILLNEHRLSPSRVFGGVTFSTLHTVLKFARFQVF